VDCAECAMYQKHVSVLVLDMVAEEYYASGFMLMRTPNPCCAG